jgi:predicted alpha/beta-hydrolase family hydrolase
VFDPGLGLLRVGFFFSRYGFNFRAKRENRPRKPRKNKQREKIPRRVGGVIARDAPESRKTAPKTGQI